MICVMGQTVSSANLLMMQNLEDQLIDQWVTVPSRGTRTGWRKWAHRNLVKVNKRKCRVLHLGENQPQAYGLHDGGWQAGKQLCWKGLWVGLGDARLNTIQQCVFTFGQQASSLLGCTGRWSSARRPGRDPSLSPWWAHIPQCCAHLWAPQYNRDLDILERV